MFLLPLLDVILIVFINNFRLSKANLCLYFLLGSIWFSLRNIIVVLLWIVITFIIADDGAKCSSSDLFRDISPVALGKRLSNFESLSAPSSAGPGRLPYYSSSHALHKRDPSFPISVWRFLNYISPLQILQRWYFHQQPFVSGTTGKPTRCHTWKMTSPQKLLDSNQYLIFWVTSLTLLVIFFYSFWYHWHAIDQIFLTACSKKMLAETVPFFSLDWQQLIGWIGIHLLRRISITVCNRTKRKSGK